MRWLNGIANSMDMSLIKESGGQGILTCMELQRVRQDLVTEQHQ